MVARVDELLRLAEAQRGRIQIVKSNVLELRGTGKARRTNEAWDAPTWVSTDVELPFPARELGGRRAGDRGSRCTSWKRAGVWMLAPC
jgi:hypothetical protein